MTIESTKGVKKVRNDVTNYRSRTDFPDVAMCSGLSGKRSVIPASAGGALDLCGRYGRRYTFVPLVVTLSLCLNPNQYTIHPIESFLSAMIGRCNTHPGVT